LKFEFSITECYNKNAFKNTTFLVSSYCHISPNRHTSSKLKNKPLLQWDQQATGGRKLTWINSLFSRKHHLVGVTLATKRPIPSYAAANVNKYMRCMFIRSDLSWNNEAKCLLWCYL